LIHANPHRNEESTENNGHERRQEGFHQNGNVHLHPIDKDVQEGENEEEEEEEEEDDEILQVASRRQRLTSKETTQSSPDNIMHNLGDDKGSFDREDLGENSKAKKKLQSEATAKSKPTFTPRRKGFSKATLVVCPMSLLGQWISELTLSTKPGTLRILSY